MTFVRPRPSSGRGPPVNERTVPLRGPPALVGSERWVLHQDSQSRLPGASPEDEVGCVMQIHVVANRKQGRLIL